MGGVKKKNSKFDYQKNRKRAWKKSKQLPGIEDANVKKAWDMKKSVNQNFKDMGLAFNLSKTFPIPKTKDMMTLAEPGEAIEKSEDTSVKKTKKVKPPPKAFVLEAFEAESKVKRVKRMPLSKPEEQFCTYLIEKHGDNYKAMARDRRNYNQETPAQLRNRIAHYHAAVKSRKQTAPMEEES